MKKKIKNQLPFESIKRSVLKSKKLTILGAILSNYYIYFSSKLNSKYTNSARTLTRLDVQEEIRKAKNEFKIFCKYGSLNEQNINSKKILEIGTGANHLIALLFIANGAKKVVTIDKFNCLRPKEELSKLYFAFYKTLTYSQRKRVNSALKLEKNNYVLNPSIVYCRKEAVEHLNESEKYDIIVSDYVFEHIHYMKYTIQKLSKITNKNGKMLAVAGVNDHGIFCHYHSQFYYLHLNKTLWNLMTAQSGRVNRLFITDFKKLLKENHFKNKIYVMKIRDKNKLLDEFVENPKKGVHYDNRLAKLVNEERKTFHKDFKHLSELDLVSDHFFIKAEK